MFAQWGNSCIKITRTSSSLWRKSKRLLNVKRGTNALKKTAENLSFVETSNFIIESK